MKYLLASSLAVLVLLLAPRAHAIEQLTAQQIISWAQSGAGYSYWWGHGRWRTDGAYHGSCSGHCPRCSHSGSYGADCSGFVAKVWRVPSSAPLSTNSHPYTTMQFYHQNIHWRRVKRVDAQKADALVYRNSRNTSGHIVLYDSADPWGTMWTYECKGCSSGCVHNLRNLTSAYRAIRRNSLIDPPTSCSGHSECSSGLCAWNGDMYCCRSPGFGGKTCYSDAECPGNDVCAYNGESFVCTDPVSCGGSSGGGSAGGTGGSTPPGGAGCASTMGEQPWRHASLGPSLLLVGLAGAWRRRRRHSGR